MNDLLYLREDGRERSDTIRKVENALYGDDSRLEHTVIHT